MKKLLLALLLTTPALAGTVNVIPEAGYGGTLGFRLTLDDLNATYLEDGSPDSETRYRVRFYFRLDQLTVDPSTDVEIFGAFDTLNNAWFRVVVQRIDGQHKLDIRARLDGNTEVVLPLTDRIVVPNDYHALELDFQSGAGDGYVHVWLDGVLQNGHQNLNNSLGNIDLARLGLNQRLESGASGFIDFDAVVANQGMPIGLVDCISEVQWVESLANWGESLTVLDLLETWDNICQ